MKAAVCREFNKPLELEDVVLSTATKVRELLRRPATAWRDILLATT